MDRLGDSDERVRSPLTAGGPNTDLLPGLGGLRGASTCEGNFGPKRLFDRGPPPT